MMGAVASWSEFTQARSSRGVIAYLLEKGQGPALWGTDISYDLPSASQQAAESVMPSEAGREMSDIQTISNYSKQAT